MHTPYSAHDKSNWDMQNHGLCVNGVHKVGVIPNRRIQPQRVA